MQYSPLQEAIFEFVERGTGNGIANAVAGSGKSTTIKEAYRRAKKRMVGNQSSVFLAFNKSIVKELQADGVDAKTLNGLGHSALMRGLDFKPELDADKVRNLIWSTIHPDDQNMYGSNIVRLVGLAKGLGVVPNDPRLEGRGLKGLTPDEPDVWYGIIDKYDIDLGDNPKADEDTLIDLARQILTNSIIQMAIIDFDDQKYLPVVMDLPMWQNQWVWLDECQDLNPIDRALVRKALHPRGRLFAVGDPHQAIYGWRGADVDSFAQVKEAFGCTEFPLSVCYRCPTSVIDYAKNWVPHITARDGAPAGLVESMSTGYDHTLFSAGDLVLCRNNAPLVSLAYRLLAAKIPVVVLGRDFGKQITNLVTKLSKGVPEGEDFVLTLMTKIMEYKLREIDKAIAKRQESKASRIADMCEAIQAILDSVEVHNLGDVTREMDGLFSDDARKNAVVLSTIHKMKGGQSKRVFILDWHLLPSRYAVSEDAMTQEANLQYVAITRSQDELRFIDSNNYGKVQANG